MVLADTEYSQAITDSAKKIIVSVIDGNDGFNYRLAFASGHVAVPAAPYLQYYAHNEKIFDGVELAGQTLYFACSIAGQVLQIEEYT